MKKVERPKWWVRKSEAPKTFSLGRDRGARPRDILGGPDPGRLHKRAK